MVEAREGYTLDLPECLFGFGKTPSKDQPWLPSFVVLLSMAGLVGRGCLAANTLAMLFEGGSDGRTAGAEGLAWTTGACGGGRGGLGATTGGLGGCCFSGLELLPVPDWATRGLTGLSCTDPMPAIIPPPIMGAAEALVAVPPSPLLAMGE